ncbi:hypothetical protein PQR68_34625 [Paraburkholderia agricolaris]|uniref:hypothetical protein n=1 Tax=Paraburkholderia agricolaris TaxID=2152888 RepID=UPI0038BCE563
MKAGEKDSVPSPGSDTSAAQLARNKRLDTTVTEMNPLVLYYGRLRRAPLLVRIVLAVSVLLAAVLAKEALRPVWVHFGLSVFLMDFVVTMAEFPVVAFFAIPAFRGLPSISDVSVKRASHADDFSQPNPFSLRLTDELNLIPERYEDENH